MTRKTRIWIALGVIIVLIGAIIGLEAWRSSHTASEVPPGHISIYLDGQLAGSFGPDDLAQLEMTSFVDEEEGKTQEGWLLRDVLAINLEGNDLKPNARIVVISDSRAKSVKLSVSEIDDPSNLVMFDLAGRGTLKLVSVLERLDSRDEWVQDVNRIEVSNQ